MKKITWRNGDDECGAVLRYREQRVDLWCKAASMPQRSWSFEALVETEGPELGCSPEQWSRLQSAVRAMLERRRLWDVCFDRTVGAQLPVLPLPELGARAVDALLACEDDEERGWHAEQIQFHATPSGFLTKGETEAFCVAFVQRLRQLEGPLVRQVEEVVSDSVLSSPR